MRGWLAFSMIALGCTSSSQNPGGQSGGAHGLDGGGGWPTGGKSSGGTSAGGTATGGAAGTTVSGGAAGAGATGATGGAAGAGATGATGGAAASGGMGGTVAGGGAAGSGGTCSFLQATDCASVPVENGNCMNPTYRCCDGRNRYTCSCDATPKWHLEMNSLDCCPDKSQIIAGTNCDISPLVHCCGYATKAFICGGSQWSGTATPCP